MCGFVDSEIGQHRLVDWSAKVTLLEEKTHSGITFSSHLYLFCMELYVLFSTWTLLQAS